MYIKLYKVQEIQQRYMNVVLYFGDKLMIKEHSHSIITFGVVLIATLFGYGLYTLLVMVGF